MRSHGSSLRGFSDNIFYKAGLRWKLPAYFLFTDLQFEIWFWNEKTYFNFEAWIYSTVYGYFTETNCKYLNKIFVYYFYNITIAIMSENRGSEVMLYFTDEVFCRLAN